MTRTLHALGLAALVALAQYAAAAAGPETGVHAGILATAKAWFFRFQHGDIDRSQLDAQVSSELTPERVAKERATLQRYGAPTSFVYLSSERVGRASAYDFLISFQSGKVVESIAFDPAGAIVGIAFRTYAPKASVV